MASDVAVYMAQWKALLKQGEQTTTQAMAEKYAGVQKALAGQLEKLAGDVIAVQEKGEVPSAGLLHQIDTYKHFEVESAQEYAKYADWAGDVMAEEQAAAAKGATSAAAEALDKKPKVEVDTESLGEEVLAAWDQGAVEEMTGMSAGGPLKELLHQGYGVMQQEIGQRLVDGVAKGMNAFEVAGDASDALGIGLDRMLTIARTEMNRAFRESTMDAYRSSGLVERYARMSARDELVCEACLAADGDTFDSDVEPDDHPNCRCTTVPMLPGEELEDLGLTDSRAWFDDQDESTQRGIMGPGRLAMYQEAKALNETEATVLWDRMVSRDVHPTWGNTLRITPLKDLSKEVGGLPKDGAQTPSHFLATKELAPYPGKSFGPLGDLMPNDAAYKAFLETDEGAKAFLAAIDAALGLGPTKDVELIAKHVETVLAKDYQSAGALDYYLKTKGFNLNTEEKAEVKAAWKGQKAEQKLAAEALEKHAAELEAQKLAAEEAALKEALEKEAKKAEQKAMIESYAKTILDSEGETIADALEVLKGYEGGDDVYKQAFYEAFIAKHGISPAAAAEQVAHEQKLAGALETLLSKDYKSPGAADYWLAHAGAQAFGLTGDEAKELKAQWSAEFKKAKAAEKAIAKELKASLEVKAAEEANQADLIQIAVSKLLGAGITDEQQAADLIAGYASLTLESKGKAWDAWFNAVAKAEPKLNIMDAVSLKNDLLESSTLTMPEKVEAEKLANAAAQAVIDAGGTKAEMLEAVQQVVDTHIAQAAAATVTSPVDAVIKTALVELSEAGAVTHTDALGWLANEHPSWPQAWKDKLLEGWKATHALTADIDAWAETLAHTHLPTQAGIIDHLGVIHPEMGEAEKAAAAKAWMQANGLLGAPPASTTPLYDALSAPAKMKVDALLNELNDIGFTTAADAMAHIEQYAEAEGMSLVHQEATLQAWAAMNKVPAAAPNEVAGLQFLKNMGVEDLTEHEALEALAESSLGIDYDTAKEVYAKFVAEKEGQAAIATPLYDKLGIVNKNLVDHFLTQYVTEDMDVTAVKAKLEGIGIHQSGAGNVFEAALEKWQAGKGLGLEAGALKTPAELEKATHELAAQGWLTAAKYEEKAKSVYGITDVAQMQQVVVAAMEAAAKLVEESGDAGLAASMKATLDKYVAKLFGAEAPKPAGETTMAKHWLDIAAQHEMLNAGGLTIDAWLDALGSELNADEKAWLKSKWIQPATTPAQTEHIVQTLVHDMGLAGIHDEEAAALYMAQHTPSLDIDDIKAVIQGMKDAGQIVDQATLPPLKAVVANAITKLGEESVAGGEDATLALEAKAKAKLAAQLEKAAGGTNADAIEKAKEAFNAHMGGGTAPVAAAAEKALAYDVTNLENALETVLNKNYQSAGAVHYWLNSSQGANLTADEKKAVQKVWKETHAGGIVVPAEAAAAFAAEHAGEAAAPTMTAAVKKPATAAEAKLPAGSKAKVDAAFQTLPVNAAYHPTMTTIDAMPGLTAKETQAVKDKWSVANAVSKSNMHPTMGVSEAKAFFAGIGVTPEKPIYKAVMDEWGKLKGFDWKAQEKLEAKAAAEEAAKVKVKTLAQIAFNEGAVTGPLLDEHLAQLSEKVTQKEKAAIQKQVKALVKEQKAEAAAAAAAAKAAEEAQKVAQAYAEAQEYIHAKWTLAQVEKQMNAEGKTVAEKNKVKSAMRDIRKGGGASRLKPGVTPATAFNNVGARSGSKMDSWCSRLYAGMKSKMSATARDISKLGTKQMNSWVKAWTGGWYGRCAACLWNRGEAYASETEFWKAWEKVIKEERGMASTGHMDIPTSGARKDIETALLNHNLAYFRDEFRLKEDTVFVRGEKPENWNSAGYRQIRQFIDSGNLAGAEGFQFTVPSYASTSLGDRNPVWGSWDIIIHAPAGTPGMPAHLVSGYHSEAEWTMARNMRYQVRKVANEGGRWRVYVDVVGKWDAEGRMVPDFSLPVGQFGGGTPSSAYETMAMAEYLKLNGR